MLTGTETDQPCCGSLDDLTDLDIDEADAATGSAGMELITTPEPVATGMAGIWALFAGLGLLMIGNGLNGAVIGIRAGTEGFSVVVIGIVMAGYFAGFLLAPTLVVSRIPKVGHIRVFAGLAATASSAVLIHAVSVTPVTWTLMRFVFGFCMAGLYVVIESWLGEMTDSTNRGRTMAIYMIVSMGGLGVGQYMVAFADPNGFRLFVMSSVLVSMSLVPITLAATTKAPAITVPEKMSIRDLIALVPTGVVGSFMSGTAVGVLFGLGAVYATRVGLSLERTAFFLVAPTIGGIIFQWPIGRLSDRVSRRSVIFVVAVLASALTALMAVLPEANLAVAILMVVLGGLMFPLYSLVVSFALDWTPDGKLLGASGSLIRINGAGALVGPLVAAPIMSALGSQWFFWTMSIAFGMIVAYVVFRISVREALPRERQRDFIPFPARAGALAISIVVKPVRKATRVAAGRQAASRQITSRHRATDIARHPATMGADRESSTAEQVDGTGHTGPE